MRNVRAIICAPKSRFLDDLKAKISNVFSGITVNQLPMTAVILSFLFQMLRDIWNLRKKYKKEYKHIFLSKTFFTESFYLKKQVKL